MTLELTVLPASVDVISELTHADSFIIGEADYALRLPFYLTHETLVEIVEQKQSKQKIYIAVNKLIHEYELDKVEQYLKRISQLNIDGIIFGDLSIYQIAKRLGITDQLIYNPETTLTNYESVGFYGKKKIKRVAIAKELTLDDIKTIGSISSIEVEILGHGVANMFHSKRDLVTNYFQFIKHEEQDVHKEEQLYLIEEKRDTEKYPIIEDQNGTHIYSSYDLCTIDHLDDLIEAGITSIRIDGLFKSDSVLKEIVALYKEAITDYSSDVQLYKQNKERYKERLAQIDGIRQFNSGFLFKKTIYK